MKSIVLVALLLAFVALSFVSGTEEQAETVSTDLPEVPITEPADDEVLLQVFFPFRRHNIMLISTSVAENEERHRPLGTIAGSKGCAFDF